jgi:REP element-mobilizing transposase RayT
MPLLGTVRARHCFLRILSEVRERYDFALLGYVVMPEHIHLLINEPRVGTPSTVMQVVEEMPGATAHFERLLLKHGATAERIKKTAGRRADRL